MNKYESVAVWLEGFALLAILVLDFAEYRRQGRERKDQHNETVEQLRLAKLQADSALDTLKLYQKQWLEERHSQLLRAISILDDIQYRVNFWRDISDNKWGRVSQASAILPPDSHTVLIQAARHSKSLHDEARDAFKMIANADFQISQFYGMSPNYRQEFYMQTAHGQLASAEPKLKEIMEKFEAMVPAVDS